jgi:hypothetical protein
VDASSGSTLTQEAVLAALGNALAFPVNEIRYSTEKAGNIFGNKYLPCDGATVSKDDYPNLETEEADDPDTLFVLNSTILSGVYCIDGTDILLFSYDTASQTGAVCQFDKEAGAWVKRIDIEVPMANPLCMTRAEGNYVILIKNDTSCSFILTDLSSYSVVSSDIGSLSDFNTYGVISSFRYAGGFYALLDARGICYSKNLSEGWEREGTNLLNLNASQMCFFEGRFIVSARNIILVSNVTTDAETLVFHTALNLSGTSSQYLTYPTACFLAGETYFVLFIHASYGNTYPFASEDLESWRQMSWGNIHSRGKDGRKVFFINNKYYIFHGGRLFSRQTSLEESGEYITAPYRPSGLSENILPGWTSTDSYSATFGAMQDGNKIYLVDNTGRVTVFRSNSLKLPDIRNAYIRALE